MRVLNRYLGGTGVSTIVELLETYGIASNAWTQGNDHATLLSARSNDYSTWASATTLAASNDWVTWNAAISNDAMTLLSARSNDHSTLFSAYSNDYSTLLSAQSNDYSTLLSAQSNDFATLLSARSNDYSTYSTLVLEYQANDYVTILAARSNDYTTFLAASSNDYSTLTAARANDYLTYIAATVNVRSEFANTALSIKFVGQPAGFWSPSSNVMYANVSGQDVTYWANAASGNVFGIMGQMNVAGNIHIFQANASVMFKRHDAGPNPGLVANGASVMLTDGHFVPRDNVSQNLGRHGGAWWATVYSQNIRASNAFIFPDDTAMTSAGVDAGSAIGFAIALGG